MTDMAVPVQMKDYGVFAATRTRPLPAGWVIPRAIATSPRMAAALDRLRWHGIRTETILADTQMDVDRFVISAISNGPRLSQGRQEARITGTLERASLLVDTGSILVPAQPAARPSGVLPARGRQRRWAGGVERDRRGPGDGTGVPGLSPALASASIRRIPLNGRF